MEDKKKGLGIVLAIFALVAVIGISYAFITQILTGTKEVVINAGVLDLVLEEENAITISDALPMYDEVGMIQEDAFVFRLVNKTANPTNYILKLLKIDVANELSTSDVKYYLTKEGVGEPKLLSSLPSNGTVDSGTIAGSDTIDYTLRLWIDSNVTDDTVISGKILSYKIDVEASQEITKLSVIEQLKLENRVDTTSTINFANISSATNGRGIYKYTEDGEDIYYWRGNIDAVATDENGLGNHVVFGGYCWEMVRTTKTGGIKMIYDGIPVGGKCENTGSNSQLSGTPNFNPSRVNNAYVGYMYGLTGITTNVNRCLTYDSANNKAVDNIVLYPDEASCTVAGGKWTTTAYEATHANVVPSTIKGVIDTWFISSNLNTEENLEKIEDTIYCSDRSISTGYGFGTNKTKYNAYTRLYPDNSVTPSLNCIRKEDRFTVSEETGNGDLTYPVGLITADEVALAGGSFDVGANNKSDDYYLYNGNYYWTISPSEYNGTYPVIFLINGKIFQSNVATGTCGIRPVISLSPTASFSSGYGTSLQPYIVDSVTDTFD